MVTESEGEDMDMEEALEEEPLEQPIGGLPERGDVAFILAMKVVACIVPDSHEVCLQAERSR